MNLATSFVGKEEEGESSKKEAERSHEEQEKHEGVMSSHLKGLPPKQCYFLALPPKGQTQ